MAGSGGEGEKKKYSEGERSQSHSIDIDNHLTILHTIHTNYLRVKINETPI